MINLDFTRARTLGRFIAVVLVVVGCLRAQVVSATTRVVPDDYATIQEAVDLSASGDVVLLSQGVFRGPGNKEIDFGGRDIVLTSQAGPEQTIIDCENAGRGFYLHNSETRAARIERITIQNGDNFHGGAILCVGSSPTISECRIINNYAAYGGGLALFLFGGWVDRCVIAGNGAFDHGAGIQVEPISAVTISNCVITGNQCRWGGGIYVVGADGPCRITACTIAANTTMWGGGIANESPITVERCIIWGNCASLDGDDIFAMATPFQVICSDVDTAGVYSPLGIPPVYDSDCIDSDPSFCGPVDCDRTTAGDWTLRELSPCLPEHSLCGSLIGALDRGCFSGPAGGCCLPDGSCRLTTPDECREINGRYMGDDSSCRPDPCEVVPVHVSTWGRVKARFRSAR